MVAGGEALSPRVHRALTAMVWILLVLAVAYFGWRGIVRALDDSGDLGVGYGAARALIAGQNPYDVDVLTQTLRDAGGARVGSDLDRLRNVYPPTTLPVFLPLAPFDWPTASLLLIGVNVGGTLVIGLGLIRLLGWRPTASRSIALLAFVLALSPVQTTIASGQTGILATALLVGAMSIERAGHDAWAGIAYGLATAAKLQIGLPFLAFAAWRRRWRVVSAGVLVVVALSVIVVARLAVAGTPWLDTWAQNFSTLSGIGGINDPGPRNPDGYTLINLQHVLLSFLPIGAWADLLTYLLVGVAGLTLVYFQQGPERDRELLAPATIAALGLLVTYHRYYDAVLLALPIAWAFWALDSPRWRQGVLVLLLAADFIVPVQAALHALEVQQVVPGWLADSLLWRAVIMTQHGWALILMTVVLLWAAAASRGDNLRRGEPNPGQAVSSIA